MLLHHNSLQVRGLEFNALLPNHLATGADEGEIYIWDIAKPDEPTHFPPLKVCNNYEEFIPYEI